MEICKVTPRGEVTGSEGEANAAFIVTACNAHEELLAACEAAYDCFGYDENWWKAGIMRTLESAIAKAGGGK